MRSHLAELIAAHRGERTTIELSEASGISAPRLHWIAQSGPGDLRAELTGQTIAGLVMLGPTEQEVVAAMYADVHGAGTPEALARTERWQRARS